jgi:hypothetical protein
MVARMAKDSAVLAFATPEPEIDRATARDGGGRIVAFSCGDTPMPNELDTAMVYPGIFPGALDIAGFRQWLGVRPRIARWGQTMMQRLRSLSGGRLGPGPSLPGRKGVNTAETHH